jgi:bifunctional DNA-binding transcriptional regulator/antitoxin component of YhaV-PrlF toxin-antitoxin module
MEAADIKENDMVEWVDRGDGSYLLRKLTKQINMEEC